MYDLYADMRQHVLGSCGEFREIRPFSKLDIAQIVHCLAFFSAEMLGPGWPEHVLILNWSTATRSAFTSLFKATRLVLSVLHDETHWALMAVLAGQEQAVCYDSGPERRPGISRAAESMCRYLSSEYAAVLSLVHADMPHQADSWSCGPRAVLGGRHVLAEVAANRWSSLPRAVPSSALSLQAMIDLCKVKSQAVTERSRAPETNEAPREKRTPEPHEDEPTQKRRLTSQPEKCHNDQATPGGDGSISPPRKHNNYRTTPEKPKNSDHSISPPGKHNNNRTTPEKPKSKDHSISPPKVSPTQAEKESLKKIENELAAKHNFTHNFQFQKAHYAHRVALGVQGHWAAFLRTVRESSATSCPACQECLQMIAEPEGKEAPAEEIADAMPAAKEGRARGRPAKGVEWMGLPAFLEERRKGIYLEVDASKRTYVCRLCDQKLLLQRDGITFIEKHEQRKLHQYQLRLWKSGLHGEGAETDEPAQALKPCMGLKIDCARSLRSSAESIANWVAGGMPFTKTTSQGTATPLQLATFRFEPDGAILLRHTQCSSQMSASACNLCASLSCSDKLATEIRRWSWNLDLIQLGHLLSWGTPEEIRQHEQVIMSRDYFDSAKHGRELTAIKKLQVTDATTRIRVSIMSIPRAVRNPSLQSLIQLRLDMDYISPKKVDKNVFQTLLRKYQNALDAGVCHRDDFALAAKAPWQRSVRDGWMYVHGRDALRFTAHPRHPESNQLPCSLPWSCQNVLCVLHL